jgi:hypothetical protein
MGVGVDVGPSQGVVVTPRESYRFVKYLAKGCFGIVALMQSTATGDLVVFKQPLAHKDLRLFLQEMELHASLTSPFVVRLAARLLHGVARTLAEGASYPPH